MEGRFNVRGDLKDEDQRNSLMAGFLYFSLSLVQSRQYQLAALVAVLSSTQSRWNHYFSQYSFSQHTISP